MPNLMGIDYLRSKLSSKQARVLTRYRYYDMKAAMVDIDTDHMPPHFRYMNEVLGWCAKAVDCVADRLVFNEFANDVFGMNDLFNMNNKDILTQSAILSALISSCSFIYISKDPAGYPRMQVIDGSKATGIIDDISWMLKEGYAILDTDVNGVPTLEAYFTPNETIYYQNGRITQVVENPALYPLLVPIINRPDAKRPFGRSRITRSCIAQMEMARRTLKDMEVSAAFYAFPQRYVLGLSDDAEPMDKWKATMSAMLDFRKDDDGDRPTVGQFQQATMSPYTEQLRTIASVFAGETGLTLDDLGFTTANPSSSDAIRAQHENLRLVARKAQRTFGIGLLNTGYLAACVRDGQPYLRNQIYRTRCRWEPIFEVDAGQLGAIGDAMMKISQAYPDYFTEDKLHDITGW